MFHEIFISSGNAAHYIKRLDIPMLDPSLPPITTRELNRIIHHLNHKSPGPSAFTSHHSWSATSPCQYDLPLRFDSCLFLGYFPNFLKDAIMIFFPWKDAMSKKHYVEKYRPISLLEIHGKILDMGRWLEGGVVCTNTCWDIRSVHFFLLA